MADSVVVTACIESKLLPSGKGGLFLDGVLVAEFPTENDSDEAAKMAVRQMIVAGAAKQAGKAYENGHPIGLWDDFTEKGTK